MKTVVGGPPHSGKSTFTAGLIQAVRQRKRATGLSFSFTWETLDITDNTLPYLLAPNGGVTRKNKDIDWDVENARVKQSTFEGRDEHLVVADAPGLLTKELNIVISPADTMIILASNEKKHEVNNWRKKAQEENMDVLATITTVLDQDKEPYWNPEAGEGLIRSVGREDYKTGNLKSYDDSSKRILRELGFSLIKKSLEED